MTAIFTLIEICIIVKANNIKSRANMQQNILDKHVQNIEIDVNLKCGRAQGFFSRSVGCFFVGSFMNVC